MARTLGPMDPTWSCAPPQSYLNCVSSESHTHTKQFVILGGEGSDTSWARTADDHGTFPKPAGPTGFAQLGAYVWVGQMEKG